MSDKTPDEQPKQQVAAKVITPNRKYFFPNPGVEIEAASLNEANTLYSKKFKQKKVGDD